MFKKKEIKEEVKVAEPVREYKVASREEYESAIDVLIRAEKNKQFTKGQWQYVDHAGRYMYTDVKTLISDLAENGNFKSFDEIKAIKREELSSKLIRIKAELQETADKIKALE